MTKQEVDTFAKKLDKNFVKFLKKHSSTAVNTSAVESSAVESSAVNTSAVNTSAVESSAVESCVTVESSVPAVSTEGAEPQPPTEQQDS